MLHAFVRVPGDFGPTTHPLEPWFMRLHGAAALAGLWIFGLLWGAHILNGWAAKRRRWSGSLVFGLVVVLIASGWLLYYAGNEDMRAVASTLHWLIGLGAPAAFVWHRWLSRDRR